MTDFPLYTTLSSGISKKDLTIAQKRTFLNEVLELEPEAHELIYALVKSYALEHKDCDTFSLPYKGQLSRDGINFDLEDFPNELKQLLYKFVKAHGKKIREDKIIQDMQKTNEAE